MTPRPPYGHPKVSIGWLLAVFPLMVLTIVLAKGPFWDYIRDLGLWLDEMSAWRRAGVGGLAGAVAALPILAAAIPYIGRWLGIPVAAYLVILGGVWSASWITGRNAPSSAREATFGERADVAILTSAVSFLIVGIALAWLVIAIRSRAHARWWNEYGYDE